MHEFRVQGSEFKVFCAAQLYCDLQDKESLGCNHENLFAQSPFAVMLPA